MTPTDGKPMLLRTMATYEAAPDEPVGVVLEHATLDGMEVDCRGVSGFNLSECSVRGAVFRDLHGSLGLGSILGLSRFENCTFQDCKIGHLATDYADIRNCSFVNCNVQNFMTRLSGFRDCHFIGRIAHGHFDLSAETENPTRATLRRDHLDFRGNDFSRCKLVDVGFRGGIDILGQRFATGDGSLIISDAQRFTTELQRYAKGRHAFRERNAWFAAFVRNLVERWKQVSIYVDAGTCARLAADAAVIRSLAKGT